MEWSRLEERLRTLVELHLTIFTPGRRVQESALQQLARAMQAGARYEDEKQIVPNVYTVLVSPGSLAEWQDSALLEGLLDAIKRVAAENNLVFAAPPTLTVGEDTSLNAGELRVIASHSVGKVAETQGVGERAQETEPNIPPNAFLIVEGTRVYPLTQSVVNIGRRLDNHVVIDDPRVSRTHAQLRAVKGRYILFDLNSTGGTYVNGQRVSQSILYPGDVISLAGVALIYGQDNPPPRRDLIETKPLSPESGERTTVHWSKSE